MSDDQQQDKRDSTPPGDFVSDDFRAQTSRFLEELRKRLAREKAEPEPRLGPPRKRPDKPLK